MHSVASFSELSSVLCPLSSVLVLVFGVAFVRILVVILRVMLRQPIAYSHPDGARNGPVLRYRLVAVTPRLARTIRIQEGEATLVRSPESGV